MSESKNSESVLVIGSGVVGIASAYFLHVRGFAVTVVEKNYECAGPGTCSYQNGGLLSPGLSSPWSYPGAWKMVLHTFNPKSPFKLRPGPQWYDMSLWRWLRLFLYYSTIAGEKNCYDRTHNVMGLANLSMKKYMELCKQHPLLETKNPTTATLICYNDENSCKRDLITLQSQRNDFGLDPIIPTIGGNIGATIKQTWLPYLSDTYMAKGAILVPGDSSGDCRKFTRDLLDLCLSGKHPFKIVYGQEIVKVNIASDKIVSVETKNNGEYTADKFVFAVGPHCESLFKSIGVRIPVCPVQGYSLNIPLREEADENALPSVSCAIDGQKIFSSRVGNALRVSAFAEIAGVNMELRKDRREQMEEYISQVFNAEALDFSNATYHTCSRPVSPDDVPYIGKVNPYSNFYVNLGHGSLGWTLACGSGFLLSQIMAGEKPDLDPAPFSPNRFE